MLLEGIRLGGDGGYCGRRLKMAKVCHGMNISQ